MKVALLGYIQLILGTHKYLGTHVVQFSLCYTCCTCCSSSNLLDYWNSAVAGLYRLVVGFIGLYSIIEKCGNVTALYLLCFRGHFPFRAQKHQ